MKKIILASMLLWSCLWAEDVYAIFNAEAIKDSNLSLATSGIVTNIFV
ncbi:MAG TPA: efflux transporter periplasmic adaptor subunit, partial [Helicobacter sp.]|nr:efflux transporter periplasmic adaptor subunit [Helicobacter sp.]